MVNQTLTSNDRSRTYWTPPMERYFIDLMLDHVQKGNRVGHTFNKQAWTDMLTMFNAQFGSKYDKDVLKGRYKNLWEQYNDVKILLEQSGFAWDETRQMVTAADHVWDTYVKEHPEMRSYKTKPILNYNDLSIIYEYTIADGRYSLSSHDVDLEDDIHGLKIGEGLGCQNSNNNDRPRTNWTPTMDRFFVDLMLVQVHKGNKIENTFNKRAWTEMIMLFNEKFESKYNKNVLRSRYKILRKHYNDMKVLLGQSGFDLDESRQMVVADDCVWEAYIKAHSDARSWRTTSVPDYNDLCLIYGNEIASGRKVRSLHDANLDQVTAMKKGDRKDSQTITNCDRSRTYWTPPMDRYFIDLMLEQVHRGNKIDNTFIAKAWIEMTMLFNAKFGSQLDKEVVKNRYKSLRKQYTDIKILLGQSGFTWDETRQMVRADDDIWDAYIKVHPDARSYRIRIVPHYDDLCLIFGISAAIGRYNRLDHNTNYENEALEISIGEGMENQDPVNRDSSGTYWTPEMDRCFIDLMLEHVHKGNKIGHTFNNEAWTDISTSFSAEYGSQYGDGVLRYQYNSLWEQYNDISNLLEQNGFSWDESQQMIIADNDDVCDTYIQEHPDVQAYLSRTLTTYSDLGVIFGNATADGGNSCEDYADVNCDVPRLTMGERKDSQPSISDCSRTYWTPSMDHYFMELMLEQVHKGNKIDYTFNKQAWADMITLFKAKFGPQHDRDVLKSRCKNLKKQFIDIKDLLSQSGFFWDETRQMVTAEDDAWDAYLKAHPNARSYRTKTVLDYNMLCAIFGNVSPNGNDSHLSENADPSVDDDILSKKTEGKDRESSATSDRTRTYWTPPMDRYLVDLMLEQVHKGNKIDNTFNRQAWVHMTTCFNTKFGSQYDKDVLKNRYKNLRKQYNCVKALLNQSGFVWDEKRQMVTADDGVWDSYIEEHPHAQSFRTKILANFDELCIIFDGISNSSGQQVDPEFEVRGTKIDGVSGGQQLSAASIAQSDPMNGEEESMPASGREKRPSMGQLMSQDSRKLRRMDSNSMQDALSEMAVVVTSLKNQQKGNENSISLENVMSELQAIPDIDEDLMLDACDLLEDEIKAKTFLALDVKLRKKWLLRKLRPMKTNSVKALQV